MTNLKDKLSASVRQAKANQAPAARTAAAKSAASKPAPAKRAAPKKPVPRKPATKPAARRIAPESDTGKAESKPKVTRSSGHGAGAQGSMGAGVPNSGNALFPDRVWPD